MQSCLEPQGPERGPRGAFVLQLRVPSIGGGRSLTELHSRGNIARFKILRQELMPKLWHHRYGPYTQGNGDCFPCFLLRVVFAFAAVPGGTLNLAEAFPAFALASEVVLHCRAGALDPGPAYLNGVPLLPDGTSGFTTAHFGAMWGATILPPQRAPVPSASAPAKKRSRPASAPDADTALGSGDA
jgi:hypothetical protein